MSDPALQDVLAALWTKYEALTRERMAQLGDSLAAAEAGRLSEEQRAAAVSDAHKLAGSLGTFGLKAASTAAAQIESALDSLPSDESALPRLRQLFATIQDAVEERCSAARQSGDGPGRT